VSPRKAVGERPCGSRITPTAYTEVSHPRYGGGSPMSSRFGDGTKELTHSTRARGLWHRGVRHLMSAICLYGTDTIDGDWL
jgi:hypothetical protein